VTGSTGDAPADQVIAITDDPGSRGLWLPRAEAVHRQLRPSIPLPYLGFMAQVFASGAEMAVCVSGDTVIGLAVYRRTLTTHHGRRMYVDDLVADAACRSRGIGGTLLDWCEARARERNCDVLTLSSGVQRGAAHRFYFRRGFTIGSFGFTKPLRGPAAG
jgi:hypothetical protein